MLVFAAGGESGHLSNSVAVSWANAVFLTQYTASPYTGSYSFNHLSGASGQSPVSANQSWASHTGVTYNWVRSNGTYWYLFDLAYDAVYGTRYLGWYYNTGDSKYYLALFDDNLGNRVATSTHGTAGGWVRWELVFDDDTWTLRSNISGSWTEEFSYGEGASITWDEMRRHLNSSNDESGKGFTAARHDDNLFWDNTGDNWNSALTITAEADFPRISIAHMPATTDSEGGTEYGSLDEIPPNHTDTASADFANYWADHENLKGAPIDLTAETIQAVLVTHVWGPSASGSANAAKFNARYGGVVYPNSQEAVVAQADDAAATPWYTYIGYFPWLPDDSANWNETNFNACDFGAYLLSGKSDQITVQVIFFGSSHEWPVPSGAASLVIPRRSSTLLRM